MINKLVGFLGIEKHEQAPLSFLFLRAGAVAIIIVATFVYQSAFFLTVFRASTLPWLYASVAIITVVFSFPYSYLHRKLGDKRDDTVTMLFFGVGLVIPLFRPDLLMAKPTLFVISIWVKLLGVFAAISFWHHATRAFPSRRAKAILPIVAAGFSLGSALAGKVIQLVVVYHGSSFILPIILGTIAINIAIPSKGAQPEKVLRARKKRGHLLKQSMTLLRTNRLALYLTLFILFTIPVFICTDFILKKAVRANFGKDGMAAFFANYQLYLNLGVFFLQTLIMGRLM
ncbi:hypothetical protein KKF84_06420, partial [Myxococcota bacterium]|nr:hypothetical protein [Myxococcota bacterium]MBU1534935.1 hypothetical protein [Myxococcota bacterium]